MIDDWVYINEFGIVSMFEKEDDWEMVDGVENENFNDRG